MVANFEGDGSDKMTAERLGLVGSGNPFEIVDNPYNTGNNTSGKVLRIYDVVMFGGFHLNLTRNIINESDKITNISEYAGLRLKYRVNNPSQFPSQIAGINVNGSGTATTNGTWTDTDKEWKTVTFKFSDVPSMPTNVQNIQMQLYKALWTNAGSPIVGLEIFVDDIELYTEVKPQPVDMLVVANFEDDGTDKMCEGRLQQVGSGSELEIVNNPYNTGNNKSEKVLKVHNVTQAGGFHLRLSTNITNEADKITNAKEYDGLRLKYKVNNAASFSAQNALINIYSNVTAKATGVWSNTTEDWKTITFNFADLDNIPNSIPSIHIVPYNAVWGTQSGLEIYLDDIELFKMEDVSGKVLNMIKVDGQDVEFFKSDNFNYVYNFPYTYSSSSIPAITFTPGIEGQNVTVIPPVKLTGTVAERTATLTVMQNEVMVNEYKVVFNIIPEMDIYLCLGQSNMNGYGDITEADKGIIENTYLMTPGKRFEEAENPLNRYSTIDNGSFARIGPPCGFANALIGKTDNAIGLLVNARNGSSIDQWRKGNDELKLYQHTIERALEAQKWGTIKGILWHQGESDSWQPTAYPNLLKTLVNNFRTDLGDTSKDIFFVAGELAYWRQNGTGSTAFNNMIQTIETFIDNSDWVSANGLTPYVDETDPHFDRASNLKIGERYAEKVIAKYYGTAVSVGNNVVNDKIDYDLTGRRLTVNCDIENSYLCIYDIYGRILFNQGFSGNITYTFPSEGMYVLVVENKGGVFTKKIWVK